MVSDSQCTRAHTRHSITDIIEKRHPCPPALSSYRAVVADPCQGAAILERNPPVSAGKLAAGPENVSKLRHGDGVGRLLGDMGLKTIMEVLQLRRQLLSASPNRGVATAPAIFALRPRVLESLSGAT